MRPLRVRKPLPGNEVEVETVTQSALQLLEMIDWYGSENYIIDVLTDPARPGLFSPALDKELCKLAQYAIEAIGLLRRLARLCGDKRHERDLPEMGVTEAERDVRWCSRGFTGEETNAVYEAARVARDFIIAKRKTGATLPDRCPKCGGYTDGVELDGRSRRFNAKGTAPARRCSTCKTVTPNVGAKVLSLVKPKPELLN